MSLHIFNNLDSFWHYVEEVSGFSRTTQHGEWSRAVKEIQSSAKYSETFDAYGRYTGVIDDSAPNVVNVGKNINTQSGVKSAPTMESVYTQSGSSTSTKTATLTESAEGIQTRGPIGMTPVMNVVTGIAAGMGLISLGITASNWHSWRDLFNYVFNANLSENAGIDDVIDFGKSRIQIYFTGVNDYTATYVPQKIADRLYTFLSSHTVPEGNISDAYTMGMFILNTFSRKSEDSSYYVLTPSSDNAISGYYVSLSDNLIIHQMTDAISQLVGAGFTIADSVSDFLITNMQGVCNYIITRSERSAEIFYSSNRVSVEISIDRGTGVPKSTPLSASEFRVFLRIGNDEDLEIGTGSEGYCNQLILQDYVSGFGCKGLKSGRTGGEEAYGDYSYHVSMSYLSDKTTPVIEASITFPSNQRSIYTRVLEDVSVRNYFRVFGMGGFSGQYDSIKTAQSPRSMVFMYSNFSYDGGTHNYKPDEYLLLAGWQKRKGTDKLPNTEDGTFEQGYQEWFHKRQQVAQPNVNGENTDGYYIPAQVPNGSTQAENIIRGGYNPSSGSQSDIQSGKMPTTTNIDDVNDDIEQAVKQFNESDTPVETAPNPLPETEPNPQYPETPPTDPTGDSGDTPTAPQIGGVTASGMVSVYNPTKQQLIDFSGWLWSSNFFDNFIKIFANPMDAIIGLHIMYATPVSGGSENIRTGYLDSGVPSKVVTQQYIKLNCGSITIPEFYGNATDYEPYTTIHIYLPFVGIVPLKTNDVLGKELKLEYGIDVLTGTCLAMLTTVKDDSSILCYTFAGNCAVQIPISGGNYAQMITSLAGFIGAGVGAIVTGNPVLALGAGASFMQGNVSVQHSGSIGANAGACGVRKPYVIITRHKSYDAINYQHYYGFPANLHTKLNTCKGYTQVKSCHVESIYRATDNEKTEIESLLKDGVIII